jgi:hypothetical protein
MGDAVMYVFASDSGASSEVRLRDNVSHAELNFSLQAERAAIFLLDRKSGKMRAKYP